MTAMKFAKENGFKTVRRLSPWNGYECYEAIYAEYGLDDVPVIGYPQIILEKSGKFRMATLDETERYMNEIIIESDD